jgi:hypothetical protein
MGWHPFRVVLGSGVLTILAVSLFGVTLVLGANPCEGPGGDHNPNCAEGVFDPPGSNPCAEPAGAANPNCVDGLLSPPGVAGDSEDSGFPNVVTIDPPSTAAGDYPASEAAFGPAPTVAGVSGDVVLVNDGSASPTLGCLPLVGFPTGAIALIDRGSCTFVAKVSNAQAAGAIAVIVVNHMPGDAIDMGGSDPTISIPSVMVSMDDGNTIKSGLPATGTVSASP